jgi:hypothetical protein
MAVILYSADCHEWPPDTPIWSSPPRSAMERSPLPPAPQPRGTEHAAVRIIAKSLLREMLSQGYSASHVVRLTSELLGLLTDSIRGSGDGADTVADRSAKVGARRDP